MTDNKQEVKINISEIMQMIPHRYPFLLVDKVLEIHGEESIVGVKNVSANEPQFMGHFPENPVMPGVLIIEAMAQISGLLVVHLLKAAKEGRLVYFMSIDNAKFRKIVRPGDTLVLKSKVIQHRGQVWKFAATAEVDGCVVAESDLMAMIKDKE